MDLNHMPLQISCWFGSPDSSVLMTGTPILTAIWIIFFQFSTGELALAPPSGRSSGKPR